MSGREMCLLCVPHGLTMKEGGSYKQKVESCGIESYVCMQPRGYSRVDGPKRKLPTWSGKLVLRAWCHPDLNRGHTDFQSDALPTELWHLSTVASAKVGKSELMTKLF